MLLSVVIAMTIEEQKILPPSLGRAAHAILLELVRAVDQDLASELHDGEEVRPFTAALLEEGTTFGHPRTTLQAAGRYHLRFTSLNERLSAVLLGKVLPSLPERVLLDQAEMRVVGVVDDHPWAGRTTYGDLAGPRLLGRGPLPTRIELLFDSPTTFRSQSRHVPVPLPDLVFGSLASRWNAFGPIRLNEDLRTMVAEGLAIGKYRLTTRLATIGGGKQVGFVGACEFRVIQPEVDLLRQVALLADFAFYAGVGHKTTMGLGRARYRQDVPRRAAERMVSHAG